MELENIMKLIDAVSSSSLTSFTLDDGETKLILESKPEDGKTVEYIQQMPQMAPMQMAMGQMMPQMTTMSSMQATNNSTHITDNFNTKAETTVTPHITGNVVKSPLVGVFYSASSPESDDFVKIGDAVKKGQTLGIVEAMKLMNEIECEYDGVVTDILVKNNDVIEFGQPMFVIG